MNYNFIQIFAIGALAALSLFVLFALLYGVKNMSLMKHSTIKQRYIEESLKVNARVVFASGLIGTIVEIRENDLIIDLGNSQLVTARKYSVTDII